MVYRLHFFGFSFRGSLLVSNILGRKNTAAGDRPPLSNRTVASESLPKLLHSTAQFFISHSEKAACRAVSRGWRLRKSRKETPLVKSPRRSGRRVRSVSPEPGAAGTCRERILYTQS